MKANKLFYFMHPVTKKVCDIYNGRSIWEDHIDKAEFVVVKVQGPAMDHWEEAMNYGIGESQPMPLDCSKYGYDDYAKFKLDALVACGISKHPKANSVFSMAWEYGHSSGFREVYNYLQDLSQLIKE